jgi:hypothetical protein
MNLKVLLAAGALVIASIAAYAQTAPLNFDQAAYVTCREAQAMKSEGRKALAVFLAEHAAQLAHLVRGGCTLAPDAYLFTVIDRALVAEVAKLPKRQ